MDPTTLTAEQILRIKEPEKLFNKDDFKVQLLRLRKRWHPDVSSLERAEAVFKHISILATSAKNKIAENRWVGEAEISFSTHADKTFRFRYKTVREFELGKMYIGQIVVMFVFNNGNDDLFRNGVSAIRGIKYPNAKMREEFSRLFPDIILAAEKTSIGSVLVVKKPEGAVLLQDLIDYLPEGRIDPKHVAWITSSLYNIVTFLDHMQTCHNSIIPSSIFIDPKNHAVFLLGGWWYSTVSGSDLKALPGELLRALPSKVVKKKKAHSVYDRQAVKSVAIACLGDPTLTGMSLLSKKDIPAPMLNWIRSPSMNDAISEYAGWEKILEKSFGKRKFVEFAINIDDMY